MTQLPLFIDFEGNLNNEQFLLGIGIDGKVKQVVLDARLKPLLFRKGYNLTFTPLQEACEQLIQICRERSTPLAGFTMHDLEVIESAIDRPIDVEYLNIHQQVKRWINKNHYESFRKFHDPPDWSLLNICNWMGYPPPKGYGKGVTTKRINDVITGLGKKNNDYSKLTKNQKMKATNLLKHNRFDIEGTNYIHNKISKASTSNPIPTASKTDKPPVSGMNEENKQFDLTKIREDHPKAYVRWTPDEERELIRLFEQEKSIFEIAKTIQRQQGGVKSRLIKLGLIEDQVLKDNGLDD